MEELDRRSAERSNIADREGRSLRDAHAEGLAEKSHIEGLLTEQSEVLARQVGDMEAMRDMIRQKPSGGGAEKKPGQAKGSPTLRSLLNFKSVRLSIPQWLLTAAKHIGAAADDLRHLTCYRVPHIAQAFCELPDRASMLGLFDIASPSPAQVEADDLSESRPGLQLSCLPGIVHTSEQCPTSPRNAPQHLQASLNMSLPSSSGGDSMRSKDNSVCAGEDPLSQLEGASEHGQFGGSWHSSDDECLGSQREQEADPDEIRRERFDWLCRY